MKLQGPEVEVCSQAITVCFTTQERSAKTNPFAKFPQDFEEPSDSCASSQCLRIRKMYGLYINLA